MRTGSDRRWRGRGYKFGTDERSVERMLDDLGLGTAVKAELERDSVMAAYEIDVYLVDNLKVRYL